MIFHFNHDSQHEAEKAKTSLEQWKQKYNQQISRSAKGNPTFAKQLPLLICNLIKFFYKEQFGSN